MTSGSEYLFGIIYKYMLYKMLYNSVALILHVYHQNISPSAQVRLFTSCLDLIGVEKEVTYLLRTIVHSWR